MYEAPALCFYKMSKIIKERYIYIYINVFLYKCEKSQKTIQFNKTHFHFLQNLYEHCLVNYLPSILKCNAFLEIAIKTPA